MNPSSPAKRRALAPLDANVNAMSPAPKLHSKTIAPGSPLKSPVKSPMGLKRPIGSVVFDENSFVAKKKQCQEPIATPSPALSSASTPVHISAATPSTAPIPPSAPTQTEGEPDAKEDQSERPDEQARPETQSDEPPQTARNRSASPDTSSVFDNSAMDTSQNTTMLTEPDQEQQARTLPPPPRLRRLFTSEEARQKARILRLKLGLASYKLQTGQEDVPLERLQMKPLPNHDGRETLQPPRVTVQPPSSRDGPPEREEEQEAETRDAEKTSDAEEQDIIVEDTPPPATEARADNDSTSAVCGGVASSLLSLARASSSVSTSS